MKIIKTCFKSVLYLSVIFPTLAFADGQSVPINYDNISFFEEPLATNIGGVTLSTNLIAEQSAQYAKSTEDDTYNTRLIGNFQAETELPNTMQMGVQYFSNYNRLADDEYTDNVAFFLSDEWGIIAIGNVTGSTEQSVRRKRGIGNADLQNEQFIGVLGEDGVFYAFDVNSYNISVSADDEGRAEVGLMFERPIGVNNYAAGVRLRRANLSDNPSYGIDSDTFGGTVVVEYSHGSMTFDAQLGMERVDGFSGRDDEDNTFASIGARYQSGAYSVSLEGGIGEYDGVNRRAASLGTRMDMARGLSFNTGVNYVVIDDEQVGEEEDIVVIGSMRYEM